MATALRGERSIAASRATIVPWVSRRDAQSPVTPDPPFGKGQVRCLRGPAKPMNDIVNSPSPLGELRVQELIRAISSDRPAPGSGAAGAIVLALAAACAAKAAAIALKHRPDDEELHRAIESFALIARRAVSAADADASAFERFLHDKQQNQAWQLILTDETLVQLSN